MEKRCEPLAGMSRRGLIGARLGLADLLQEPWMFVCQIAALAAVVAPLLVLAGLRVGVVEGLLAELRDDPANRRVIIRGDQTLQAADIAWIQGLPEVGFALPATRSIAARAFLSPKGGGDYERAGLLPSAAGDPLLPAGRAALNEDEIALSTTLRRRLNIVVGDTVIARNTRGEQHREAIELPVKVVEIVRDDWLPGSSALVHPMVLERIEAFLDGFAIPELGIDGRPPETRPLLHENMRLYARRIEDVASLVAQLDQRLGVETVSAEERIKQIQALDRNLLLIFALVTLIAGLGLVLSMAAQVWANVERKRGHLSVLRLMGGSRLALALFPLTQAGVIAATGFGAAFCMYRALATVINLTFAAALPANAALCRLAVADVGAAAAGTVLAVAGAAVASSWRASRVEPFDGIVSL
jgi:putative ABC transport system permease protein